MENVDTNNLAKQGQALADKATPYLSRVAGQAQNLGKQGADAVNDVAQRARKTASQASESIVSYTQDNPVKALLIAAAAGALLIAFVKAVTPSRD